MVIVVTCRFNSLVLVLSTRAGGCLGCFASYTCPSYTAPPAICVCICMHALLFLCVSMGVYMRQSRYRSQRINLGYLSLSSTLIERVSLLFACCFWGLSCLYLSSCVGTPCKYCHAQLYMGCGDWNSHSYTCLVSILPNVPHPTPSSPLDLNLSESSVPQAPVLVIFLILMMGACLCVLTANNGTRNPNCYLRN